HVVGGSVERAGQGDAVAVAGKKFLYFGDGRIAFTEHVERARRDRRRFHPNTYSRTLQSAPREFFSRIALARGSDVGMAEDALGGNPVTRLNAAAQRGHRSDLALGKIGIA